MPDKIAPPGRIGSPAMKGRNPARRGSHLACAPPLASIAAASAFTRPPRPSIPAPLGLAPGGAPFERQKRPLTIAAVSFVGAWGAAPTVVR